MKINAPEDAPDDLDGDAVSGVRDATSGLNIGRPLLGELDAAAFLLLSFSTDSVLSAKMSDSVERRCWTTGAETGCRAKFKLHIDGFLLAPARASSTRKEDSAISKFVGQLLE